MQAVMPIYVDAVMPNCSNNDRMAKVIQFPQKVQQVEILREARPSRAAEPIEAKGDINKIISYCLNNKKWRDALLFVLGFNFGMRVSDLRLLQLKHLVQGGRIVDLFSFGERKTRKDQTIYVNEAARAMLDIYMQNMEELCDESYLFFNKSRNQKYVERNGTMVLEPMSRQSVDRIIKKVVDAIGLSGHYATHTLRKTPGFQVIQMSSDYVGIENTVGIQMLQAFYGHSNVQSTLHYTGFTEKQRRELFERLNLGLEAIQMFKEEQKGE